MSLLPPDEDPDCRSADVRAASLDTLLDRHLPQLHAFVRVHAPPFVRARESCSDLVQSTCRELIAKGDEFEYRGEGPFRMWLYGTVLNKLRERERYYRAQKRTPAQESGSHAQDDAHLLRAYHQVVTPSEHAIALEKVELFERCFRDLAPDYRAVLSWRKIVGLTPEETADRMGRSVGSVRNLLHRAVCRLSTLLDRAGAG